MNRQKGTLNLFDLLDSPDQFGKQLGHILLFHLQGVGLFGGDQDVRLLLVFARGVLLHPLFCFRTAIGSHLSELQYKLDLKHYTMTFYFRPLSIQPATTQGHPQQQHIKPPSKVKLILLQLFEDKERELSSYQIQMNSFVKDGNEFFAVPVKTKIRVRIEASQGKREKLGESEVQIKEVLFDFKGSQEDKLQSQVWFEEYMLTYQYRYNRYLSICGGSVLKEWTLQYPNPSHKKISSLVEESGNPLPNTSSTIIKIKKQQEENEDEMLDLKLGLQSKIQDKDSKSKRLKYPQSTEPEISFYRGPCKSTNLFSMLDRRDEHTQSQFSVVEKTYK